MDAVCYNDKVVRQFALMTVVWGVVGMLVGVIIAAQMLFPVLNFDLPWLTFSRLRPLHTPFPRADHPPDTGASYR